MQLIYDPTGKDGPMKVFWMFSGGASSLKATLTDPNNGRFYRNVGAYTDKEHSSGRQLCRDAGIGHFSLNPSEFYLQRNLDRRDPESKRIFHEYLKDTIQEDFCPDLICLSGYMRIVHRPLLGWLPILNVHPADLGILVSPEGIRFDTTGISDGYVRACVREGCRRMLTGGNAVYDAIKKGERFTRSTVHVLTEEIDGGPILTQSRRFTVGDGIPDMVADPEGEEFVRRYAKALQGRMKDEGDGPAYLAALEMISQGRMALDGDKVFLSGEELPYCGFRLG